MCKVQDFNGWIIRTEIWTYLKGKYSEPDETTEKSKRFFPKELNYDHDQHLSVYDQQCMRRNSGKEFEFIKSTEISEFPLKTSNTGEKNLNYKNKEQSGTVFVPSVSMFVKDSRMHASFHKVHQVQRLREAALSCAGEFPCLKKDLVLNSVSSLPISCFLTYS